MSHSNKRFKGVENFLRRIAFNLGNTPSQTEVKIISCIPIDVTDLQQKIAELEKKLEEHQSHQRRRSNNECPPAAPAPTLASPGSKPGSKRTSVVNTAAVTNPMAHKHQDQCQDSCLSTTGSQPNHPQKSTLLICDPKYLHNEDCKPQSHQQHLFQQPLKKCLFAKNRSRSKKKGFNKTELVYYAKTDESTPFNKYRFKTDLLSTRVERHDEVEWDETRYLSSLLWKQYIPRPALNNLSNHSEFSSPICRDDPPLTTLYESDVCSCCHGPFQNLDAHMKPFNTLHTFSNPEKENENKYSYYDSNSYDIVPVKEINTKNHNSPKPKKKRKKHDTTIKCWPEKVRPKKLQPIIVNYHTVAPIRNNPYNKYHKRDVVLRPKTSSSKRPILRGPDQNSDDTRICYVDYSDVYARRKKPRNHKFNAVPKLNDVSCVATIINNADCQTSTETNESPSEDRTATTLSQIKTILQSVLQEVKTSSNIGKNQQPKKDAIVQNISQSNICGGEQLLQSCTYSPYNMNPYMASCSRQMTSNSYGPTTAPYGQTTCMHYPLFVQPNRNMCSSCYKNGNGKPIGLLNFATSAATNTEEPIRRSKETQKLIKDIYDSIALNIEIPTKDSTKNKGDQETNITLAHDLKPTPSKVEPSLEKPNHLISEIYKNLNETNISVTEKTDSKETSIMNSVRSEYSNKITVNKIKTESSEGNTTTTGLVYRTSPNEQVHRRVQRVYRGVEESDEVEEEESSDINEDNEVIETSTHTVDQPEQEDSTPESEPYESDMVQVRQKRNNKKGLFNKMMKIFQPRNRMKSKQTFNQQPVRKDETTSDSDDYQTVYSHKITRRAQPTKHKPHPKAQVSRGRSTFSPERAYRARNKVSPDRASRRLPYLEQEYRRYWDEKIMFRNQFANHSTESGATPQTTAKPYNRHYETRVALTEPNARIAPLKSTTYPVKRPSFSGNRLKKSNPKVGGLAWLKKHKLNIKCGPEWKKLILEG